MQLDRGLVPVTIIEEHKRPEPIDVRKFFTYTQGLDVIIEKCKGEPLALLEWVQTHITPQIDTGEYWRFPYETLAVGKGDCEDGAILLANLLLQAGYSSYKVVLAHYVTHVVVEFDGQVLDWTSSGISQPLWYCWNPKRAYTTKEHVEEWKR